MEPYGFGEFHSSSSKPIQAYCFKPCVSPDWNADLLAVGQKKELLYGHMSVGSNGS